MGYNTTQLTYEIKTAPNCHVYPRYRYTERMSPSRDLQQQSYSKTVAVTPFV